MRLTELAPWRWGERSQLARTGNDPFAALQQEMNQLLESFFEESPMKFVGRGGAAAMAPKLDVSETDKELHISAELPGMKEEDIDVEFSGDTLRIRGEKKDERDEKQHNFHRIERSFGMFERAIPIPVEVDREQAQATFKNGVLTITLPKSEKGQLSQKIAVKSGDGQSRGNSGEMKSEEKAGTKAGKKSDQG
jgi:HSP20 family protein